jgi:hypothetical protein
MVEGKDKQLVEKTAQELAELIRKDIGQIEEAPQ